MQLPKDFTPAAMHCPSYFQTMYIFEPGYQIRPQENQSETTTSRFASVPIPRRYLPLPGPPFWRDMLSLLLD